MARPFKHSLLYQSAFMLFLLSLAGTVFFLIGALRNHSMEHWYLLWNMLLAWVPFILSTILHRLLGRRQWSDWLPLLVTLLWLMFLPNAFYMLTDYIHLDDVQRIDEIYDVITFTFLIAAGLLLGFASIATVEHELKKRLPEPVPTQLVTLVLLLASLAVYFGRDLRWNTWDIVVHPAGILFDISERIIHPLAHPETYITTLSFFVLLSLSYFSAWRFAAIIRKAKF